MGKYKRVLVQDSTLIRLPLRLFEIFSGVKNATSVVCHLRIQGVYDLVSRQFIKFSIDSYSKNDASVALDLHVEPGDLVLRDRGYFSIKAIHEFKQKGADSILRYKHKKVFYDIDTGEEIHLLEYLNKHGSINKPVFVGVEERYKVRIVAKRVNEEVANLRRMKAKKEYNGKNPSKEVLKLMSWTIFITSIIEFDLSFEDISKLYELRWRIENIIKTWKSNFNFTKVHNVSAHQIRVLIFARLIMTTFFFHHLFIHLTKVVERASSKTMSMMKFMRYISKNLEVAARLIDCENISNDAIYALVRFCTYDNRKRTNYEKKISELYAIPL